MRSLVRKLPVTLRRPLRRMKHISRVWLQSKVAAVAPDYWYHKKLKEMSEKGIQSTPFKVVKKPHIILETTNICNLNCVMCGTMDATRVKGFMRDDDFTSNLDLLEASGQDAVVFHTVGDPLVDKNLKQKLKWCYERDIAVTLRTNGLLLDRFMEALLEYPPAVLLFSVDGATKATYEKIRIGGKFSKLLKNIRMLSKAFKKKKILCLLGIDMVVCDDNLSEIPIFYEVFHPYFSLHNMHFNLMGSISGNKGDYFQKDSVSKKSQLIPPCHVPFSTAHILHDQRVSVCGRDYHGDLVVGDLKKNTLSEIWSGEKATQIRNAHNNLPEMMEALPRACQECFAPNNLGEFDIFVHNVLQKGIDRHGPYHLPKEEIVRKIKGFLESTSD